jgi:hypothetical protein
MDFKNVIFGSKIDLIQISKDYQIKVNSLSIKQVFRDSKNVTTTTPYSEMCAVMGALSSLRNGSSPNRLGPGVPFLIIHRNQINGISQYEKATQILKILPGGAKAVVVSIIKKARANSAKVRGTKYETIERTPERIIRGTLKRRHVSGEKTMIIIKRIIGIIANGISLALINKSM